MFHDMSKEFWHAASLALLACGVTCLVLAWLYADIRALMGSLGFFFFGGSGYALQLRNHSKSRQERAGDRSSGL